LQGEQRERRHRALKRFLDTSRPPARIRLPPFSRDTKVTPVTPADAGHAQRAIESVRTTRLRGGTDLQRALQAGFAQATAPGIRNAYLVILSDGGATRGPIQNRTLASWYASSWKQLPDTQRPRTYLLAVGDD